MIRIICKHTLLLCSLLTLALPVAADSVAIIVNSENTHDISITEVKYLYYENIVTWPSGERVERYNLPPSEPAREVFSRKVLGISARVAAQQEQNRKVNNSARNPAREKRTPLVAAAVVRKPNAIGYIDLAYAKRISGIRIMHVIND